MRSVLLIGMSLVALAGRAHAEEDELRITVAPQGAIARIDAFATHTTGETYGGYGAVAHGLADQLELAFDVGYQTRSDLAFEGPELVDIAGDDLTLFANLHEVRGGAAVRYLVGGSVVPLFARLHPTMEVGAGLAHRRLTNLMAFTAQGTFAGDVDDQAAWQVYGRARAGVAFRWTDHLQLGLLAELTGTATMRAAGVAVELSWQRTSPLAF